MEPIVTSVIGKAICGFLCSYIGGKSIDVLGDKLKQYVFPKRAIRKAVAQSITDTLSSYPTIDHCFESVAFQETVAHEVGKSFISDQKPDYERVASHIYELSPKSRDISVEAAEYLLHKIERNLAAVPFFRPDIALQISTRNSAELVAVRDAVANADCKLEGMGAELKELRNLLQPSVSIETTTIKARKCAAELAQAWLRRKSILSDCYVDISLKHDSKTYSLTDVPMLLDFAKDLVLVGAPGAGKTVALIHLAGKILAHDEELVPILISYPELISAGCGLLEFTANRSGYGPLSTDEVQQLGTLKRLVFLIDGWNEANGRDRLVREDTLSEILFHFDGNGFVVSTRRSAEPPGLTDGMLLDVAPITAAQRTEVINRTAGPESGVEEYIYDHPELDRITCNPFFLSCLVSLGDAAFAVTTKEGILSSVVDLYEGTAQHNPSLINAPVRSNHRAYLAAIAFEMMDAWAVLLSRKQAYRCIQRVSRKLVEEDLLAAYPEPQDILEVLAGHHLLTLEGENVGFEHQLIQEWFASFKVQEEYLAAVLSGIDLFELGRVRYVDIPFWEETLLFVVERLSQGGQTELSLLSKLVKDGLRVDPWFVAEMVHRGGERLWPLVREEIFATLTAWHEEGKVDRAFSAMIATGHGEFADLIWPFLEHKDSQVHLKAYRAFSPFRIGCLGGEWRKRFDSMPEELRETFVFEVLNNGNTEGCSAAKDIGSTDSSMRVRVAAVVGLSWCGQNYAVEHVLKNAPDEFWTIFSKHHNAIDVVPSSFQKKLWDEILSDVTNHYGANNYYTLLRLDSDGCPRAAEIIVEEVLSGDIDFNAREAADIINRALAIDPQKVTRRIAEHVLAGGFIPIGFDLKVIEVPQDMLAELVELTISEGFKPNQRTSIVGPWLSETDVRQLLCRYLEHAEKHLKNGSRPEKVELGAYWGLESLLVNSGLDHLCAAAIDTSWDQNETTIGLVSSLLIRNGRDEKITGGRFVLPTDILVSLNARVDKWIEIVLGTSQDPDCLSSLTMLLGRIGAKGALDRIIPLLDIEIIRYKAVRDKIQEWYSKRRGGQCPYDRTNFFDTYRDVLISLGDPGVPEQILKYLHEPHFAVETIVILAHYARLQDGHKLPKLRHADFSKVHEERARRRHSDVSRDAHPYVKDILKCLDEINGEELADGFTSNLISTMACRLVYMEYGSSFERILKHISKDYTDMQGRGALLCMTLKGDVVPFESMESGFDAAYDDCSKNNPHRSDQWYPVFDWLKLMLFSDAPERALSRINLLPKDLLNTREMGQLYRVVGHCKHPVAVSILTGVELETLKSEALLADWIEALASSRFGETLGVLIEILEGRLKEVRLGSYEVRKRMATAVAEVAKGEPRFADRILKIAEGPLAWCKKELLADVYLEMGTEDALRSCLLLLDDKEIGRIPVGLKDLIYKATTDNIPYKSSGLYTIEPRLNNEVRLLLFKMSHGDEKRKLCARLLLSQLDIRRDELGRPSGEHRHPDYYSGLDWPILN